MAMMRMVGVLIVALTLSLPARGDAWTFEAYAGDARSLRTRLEVEQDGGYSRSLRADYDTRGFEPPLYYLLRAARWHEDRAWEISLVHHKLYLANPPDGVTALSISHGFNILSLNRAARAGNWVYRAGGGPVVTHAEGEINGVRYDGPYRLSGAALLAAGGWRLKLGESLFLSAELMATAGYASPKMPGPPDARIRATNVALHALAGIGCELR